jgi:hypothetical protein
MTISTRWPRGTFCGPRAACKTHAATDLGLGRAWSRRLLNTPSHRRSTARKLSSACPKQREHVLPTSRNQHSAQRAVPRPSRRTTPDRYRSASTWIGPRCDGDRCLRGVQSQDFTAPVFQPESSHILYKHVHTPRTCCESAFPTRVPRLVFFQKRSHTSFHTCSGSHAPACC